MYCKYSFNKNHHQTFCVLIVAKCIVNDSNEIEQFKVEEVLIVAKCIVNNHEVLFQAVLRVY